MTDLVSIGRRKSEAPAEEDSFEDQVLFFTRFGKGGPAVQKRLGRARVVVFGAGLVGSHALSALADSGIGTLRVVDDAEEADGAEAASAQTNGGGTRQTRSQALALRIAQSRRAGLDWQSASADADSDDEVAEVIDGADCVLVCADAPSPALLESVNRAALRTKARWLAGQLYRGVGIVGPAVIPGESACYKCYELRRNASLPNYEEVVRYEARLREMRAIRNPRVAPRPLAACVGALVALEALRLVSGEARPQTLGRILRVDFFSPEMTYHTVLPVPGCPACGYGRRRP